MEKVLIIEDDSTMLRGLHDNFAYAGYNVLTARDGQTGLNTALDAKPDLIILDIMLPHINGYEICDTLRKQKLEMPIIMLTAKGEESDIILGLENLKEKLKAEGHTVVQKGRSKHFMVADYEKALVDIAKIS